jgi:hypothetical protein
MCRLHRGSTQIRIPTQYRRRPNILSIAFHGLEVQLAFRPRTQLPGRFDRRLSDRESGKGCNGQSRAGADIVVLT